MPERMPLYLEAEQEGGEGSGVVSTSSSEPARQMGFFLTISPPSVFSTHSVRDGGVRGRLGGGRLFQ